MGIEGRMEDVSTHVRTELEAKIDVLLGTRYSCAPLMCIAGTRFNWRMTVRVCPQLSDMTSL